MSFFLFLLPSSFRSRHVRKKSSSSSFSSRKKEKGFDQSPFCLHERGALRRKKWLNQGKRGKGEELEASSPFFFFFLFFCCSGLFHHHHSLRRSSSSSSSSYSLGTLQARLGICGIVVVFRKTAPAAAVQSISYPRESPLFAGVDGRFFCPPVLPFHQERGKINLRCI